MPSSHNSAYRGADYLLGVLVLLLSGLLLIWAARFLQPLRLPPVSPGSYHFIGRLDDLAPGGALSFVLEGQPWLLSRRDGDISAVSGLCTFRGSKILWDEDNQVFLCEGHGCTFGHGGHRIQGLAAAPLETLSIRIVGDRIYGARRRS